MKLRTKLTLILFVSVGTIFGQAGSTSTYKFLNVPGSARLSAFGGHVVSIADSDINLANHNPAALNEEMYGMLSLGHKFLFNGIHSQNLDYGFRLPKFDIPFHAGIHFVNYGEADMTDIYGDIIGKVSGSDLALVLGTSYRLYENLDLGINTRFIYSTLGTYNSFGMTIDMGAIYHLYDKNIDIGFVIKNIGGTIMHYSDDREIAPTNVMLGLSKRLEHLPFRLNITATHLNRWNLLYDDPEGENNIFLGVEAAEKSRLSLFADNLFRHLIFSGEFMLGKGEGPFRLRLSYNHRTAKEMSIDPYRSFSGFGFGFGLQMKRFKLDYAYHIQNLVGGKSHLTISTNLQKSWSRL